MVKVIKSISEYEDNLSELEVLLERNPKEGTAEANKVELLLLLIKDFESQNFPIEAPDPIEAILFRMEQLHLTQRDLIPFVGSRSKVSEVLSRKRPLTLSMIRALHKGLGIPVKSLVQESKPLEVDDEHLDWNRFPIREMINRGWIKENLNKVSNRAEDIIKDFLKPLGSRDIAVALYKKSENVRSTRPVDKYALTMWNARIQICALENSFQIKYKPGTVNQSFMKEIARFSTDPNGPRLAYDFIRNHSIAVVIEPYLPGTHLDGASIMTEQGPIIGLTLRYDRLDNFWFCLMHELAHIALHLDNNNVEKSFFDYDLDIDIGNNAIEAEADKLASEVLIPEDEWRISAASRLRTPEAAQALAKKLGINTAIVAGRMRHFFKTYRILNNLLGFNQVRTCFPEVKWS